jgi:15-cis-phytoene synthase
MKAFDNDPIGDAPLVKEHPLFVKAYQRCEEITHSNSKTFYTASNFLPAHKKNAVRALYAFCRISDDIIDCGGDEVLDYLQQWKDQIREPGVNGYSGEAADQMMVALAWSDARKRFRIPGLYSEQLLEGLADDLHKNRYQDFNELAAYCYSAACTVGLMSMHITGYSGQEAIPYAVRLGVALQLTNILRDVGADWRIGRLYLPKEEMDAFNLTEEDIDRGVVTRDWREFMRFQIERTRMLYESALPGVRMLDRDGRFAIGAAAELYQAILLEIEKNDYQVFTRRAYVKKTEKIRRLPGIWWRSWLGRYPEYQLLHDRESYPQYYSQKEMAES